MNNINKILAAFLLLIITQSLFSQAENFGTWTTIGIEKKVNKWDFGAETELRTVYYVRLIERWSLGVSADYNINKPIKVGVGYDLMSKLDTKYLNYQMRNRMNVFVSGKLKFNDLSFTLRERVQVTTKDESKRIEDGIIDTYKVNPEWSWRNRLQMSYNIPNFKITPSVSVETFYQLNNPDGNTFDNLRYILSFGYKHKKNNLFELYGVLNTVLDSDDALGKYILGLSYKYSL
ncbi:MAG TPA: DUF2490 domain-containing protein [Paludibacter sp.]|nr:DUF2490 domain-containing protein [Paludibacter sp.]